MSDRYQISGWLEGCLQREIELHVINERERIIKMLRSDPEELLDSGGGLQAGYETAIELIESLESE